MSFPDQLRGIITVLNIPFDEQDRIHLPSLRQNVRNAIEAGVAGFLVPAMASEVLSLQESERTAVVEAVLEESQQEAVVIGGASATNDADRIRIARRLIEMGCDGILVSIPFENDDDYQAKVRDIARLEPGFLMLQDWDASGGGLPISLIYRLFREIDVFRSLKVEVVAAGEKYSRILEATDGQLHLAGGWAVAQMTEALDRGVHAFMPTAMHAVYTRIYDLHRQGLRPEAVELFEKLLPVLAFSNQHLDISIQFFKRLLWRQGVYPTDRVRAPTLRFDAHHCPIADELIERVTRLEAGLHKESLVG